MTTPDMIDEGSYYRTPSNVVALVKKVTDNGKVVVDIAGYVQEFDIEEFCKRFSYISIPPLE